MKQVLIIDESPLFREFLRLKLEENDIEVIMGINAMDGLTKMRNTMPDLVIIDSNLSRHGYMDVLKEKKAHPNTVNIPVVIMTQRLDQKRLMEMVPYNVKKVFTKPVKIDAMFVTFSEILGIPFKIDDSPGIVEVHVNDNIIFIEIAQGLNSDKLDLLRFRIIELTELYEIRLPKVIVMLSDINPDSKDNFNLEKLLLVVTKASKAKNKFIRVLTNNDYTRKFIKNRKEYADIEVASNLQDAMDGLLSELDANMNYAENKAEIIGDKLLSVKDVTENEEKVALRFDAELSKISIDYIKESVQNLRIAVIDDDFVIQELIVNVFRETGAIVKTYSDGEEFLAAMNTEEFDLAFLDLMMPKKDGFAVLSYIQTQNINYPIIVFSSLTQRDTVLKAYSMGVRSYLVKPLKPQDIFKKSMEILKPSF